MLDSGPLRYIELRRGRAGEDRLVQLRLCGLGLVGLEILLKEEKCQHMNGKHRVFIR